jgi:importin-5
MRTRKNPQTGNQKEIFQLLQAPQKNAIRAKLLQCWETESLMHVRNKIGDAVAEVARQYSEDSEHALNPR